MAIILSGDGDECKTSANLRSLPTTNHSPFMNVTIFVRAPYRCDLDRR